jgi:hypothetical protein
MQAFRAIIVVEDATQPPGIWPQPPSPGSPGHPSHPIAGQPPYPSHPIEGGGGQPGQGPHPEHPWVPPSSVPPGIWPPPTPSHPWEPPTQVPPDGIAPGLPSHPIVLPPSPPEGVAGVVLDIPPHAAPLSAPPPGTPPDYKPYLLWYGAASKAEVVYLPPAVPRDQAQPKA